MNHKCIIRTCDLFSYFLRYPRKKLQNSSKPPRNLNLTLIWPCYIIIFIIYLDDGHSVQQYFMVEVLRKRTEGVIKIKLRALLRPFYIFLQVNEKEYWNSDCRFWITSVKYVRVIFFIFFDWPPKISSKFFQAYNPRKLNLTYIWPRYIIIFLIYLDNGHSVQQYFMVEVWRKRTDSDIKIK